MSAGALVAPDPSIGARSRRESTSTESRLMALAAAMAAAAPVVLSNRWHGLLVVAVTAAVIVSLRLIRIDVSAKIVSLFLMALFVGGMVGGAGLAPLVPALMLTGIEARRGLRRAAWLSVLRDSLWRLTGTLAAVIAALAVADRVERGVYEAAIDTPLEGLALWLGVLSGVLFLIVLLAAVWLLPRIAAARMSAGAAYPAAVSDALWFGTFSLLLGLGGDARAIAATGAFSDAAGKSSWIALAGCFAFAAVRIGLSTAAEPEVQSLWIVFLGNRHASPSMQRHAAVLAARWRNGPVTIVAPPEVAPTWAGAHLRLAQMRGRLEALFPQRAIHLADWLDTLPPPDRWQALPIRELYADAALWPQLFETELDPTALIVVVAEKEPEVRVIDRLRTFLPTSRTDFHLAVPEHAGLTARWPGVEIYPIAGRAAEDIDRWIAGNAKQREEPETGRRLVLVAHAAADADFAKRLAEALRGQTDARGKTVHGDAVLVGGGIFAAVWKRARSKYWRQGVLARHTREAARGRWYASLSSLFASILSLGIDAEYDLLVIERPGAMTAADLRRVVESPLLKSATRVIAVAPRDGAPLVLPPEDYAGMIVLRPEEAVPAWVAEVARRYLALELEPVTEPVARPAATPEQPKRRPRVFLSFARPYQDVAKELAVRLTRTCEVVFMDGARIEAGRDWMRELDQALVNADIVVAVIGPDTSRSNFALSELEIAASLRKPVLPVVMDRIETAERIEMPSFIAAMPANTDENGARLDLTAPDGARHEYAMELTVANIESALARLPV